jgi:GT2 family glycosyltransferase
MGDSERSQAGKVSIIVVSFNSMPHIETCLTSLHKQDYKNIEVIFVDNGSTDGSLDYARSRFPSLVIVANKTNLGYIGGINSGVAVATGEYIAPLNIDTEVAPDWLASMVAFIDKKRYVGAVTPKILLFHDRAKINATGLNVNVTGLSFANGLNQTDGSFPNLPMRVFGISGCSYLIRREILEKTHAFNDVNFMYYDDVNLSWLINLMGYDIYCVPESVVYHKYNLMMTADKLFLLEYGRLSALTRYLKWYSYIILLPFFIFTELMISSFCLLHGKKFILAKIRSVIRVMKNFSSLMKVRREANGLRTVSDFKLIKKQRLNYEWRQLIGILR